MLNVKIKFNSPDAQLPTKWDSWAAWYDLYAIEDFVLHVWERALLKTWISLEIPSWYYWRIAPRSWLAFKNGIDVLAWVIDSSYRWDIWVILYNTSKTDTFFVEKWMRIAQIIFEQCNDAVFTSDAMNETQRWDWWFGSTWI
jgi:dUTP pyrophosphatase